MTLVFAQLQRELATAPRGATEGAHHRPVAADNATGFSLTDETGCFPITMSDTEQTASDVLSIIIIHSKR